MNNPTNNFRQELIDFFMKNLDGRMCYVSSNCNYLAWAVANAGDGNHLEIGTLHGGSAILAVQKKTAISLVMYGA